MGKPIGVLAQYSRFLIPLAWFWALGLLLAAYDAGLSAPAALCWLLISLGVGLVSQRRAVLMPALWTGALLLGGLYYQHFAFAPPPGDISHKAPARAVRVTGRLLPYGVGARSAELRVSALNGRPVSGKILLRAGNLRLPEPGVRIEVSGNLALPGPSRLPGAFDEIRYYHSQHITAVLYQTRQLTALEETPSTAWGRFDRWLFQTRSRVAGVFQQAVPSPASEIFAGVVLGEHAVPLDWQVKQQFIQTGLIHILAASGMNVGIVAGFLFLVARLLRLPWRVQIVCSLLGVGLYAMLTGLPPSIQRASLMLAIALLLKFFNRELSGLYLLTIAVIALLVFNPVMVTSIGFQFSVITTLGLIVMIPPLVEMLGYYIKRQVAGVLLVPVVAQLWVLPAQIAYFNQFSLQAVVLNIVVLPLVAVSTTVGFVSGLFALIWTPLAGLLAGLAAPAVQGLLWLVDTAPVWAFGPKSLPVFSPAELVVLYATLVLLACLLNLSSWRSQVAAWSRWVLARCPNGVWSVALVALLVMALGVTALALSERRERTRAEVSWLPLDSPAVLLRQGADRHVLILPLTLSRWETRPLLDYLRHRQILSLDAVVLVPDDRRRHLRNDGLESLLERVPVYHIFQADELPSVATGAQVIAAGERLRLADWRVTAPYRTAEREQAGWRASLGSFCLPLTPSAAAPDCPPVGTDGAYRRLALLEGES